MLTAGIDLNNAEITTKEGRVWNGAELVKMAVTCHRKKDGLTKLSLCGWRHSLGILERISELMLAFNN